MTTCTTVTVLTPANIVSTLITAPATCVFPCSGTTVDITWTNSGQTAGDFTPTIVTDSTQTSLATESLGAGASVTKTFTLTGLSRGPNTISALPAGATPVNIIAQAPANIIPKTIETNMGTETTQNCTYPCPITVSATWENTGDISGNFTPNISIDGTPVTPPIYGSEPLAGGSTSAVKTFAVTGLTAAPHTICPV